MQRKTIRDKMKKALMYLALALGITLVVLFVGGAVGGFIVGFVDGFNGAKIGTSSPAMYVEIVAVVLVVLWTVAIQWTFLRNRFASYTIGLIPKNRLWTVTLMTFIAFAGINMLEMVIYNPLNDTDLESQRIWQWIATHRWQSILLLIPVDITFMLVLYGAIFREIAEWKPNAESISLMGSFALAVTLPVFVISICLQSDIVRPPYSLFVSVQLACMVCLSTRSVVPLLIGGTLADVLNLAFIDVNLNGWYFFPSAILMFVGALGAWKATESYRPID